MLQRHSSYHSPKLVGIERPDKGGRGLVALKPVRDREVLVVFGGDIVTGRQLKKLTSPRSHPYVLQVEEDLYLLTIHEGAADWVNHSCEPNAGLQGQIVLVAMRDISVGEEVCFDYAMSDGSPYDEFTCCCGAACCRGRVTGNDWRDPALRERYADYFSPYLVRRIERERPPRRYAAAQDLSRLPGR